MKRNWQHTLDISKSWLSFFNGAKDFKEIATEIIEKLNQIDFGPDINGERDGILSAFDDLIVDEEATVGHFDSLMDELYNFGDEDNRLFVKTF